MKSNVLNIFGGVDVTKMHTTLDMKSNHKLTETEYMFQVIVQLKNYC